MDDVWVQRNEASPIHVTPIYDHRDGNLATDVPTIAIVKGDSINLTDAIFLTWDEAVLLAEALLRVQGVLRNG